MSCSRLQAIEETEWSTWAEGRKIVVSNTIRVFDIDGEECENQRSPVPISTMKYRSSTSVSIPQF